MCYADTWCFILKAVKDYSSLPCVVEEKPSGRERSKCFPKGQTGKLWQSWKD